MQQVEVTTSTEALSALVQRVEDGNVILITRQGKPVARVTPVLKQGEEVSELTSVQQERARQATAGIRDLASRLNLGPFDFEQFKKDRDEGRR